MDPTTLRPALDYLTHPAALIGFALAGSLIAILVPAWLLRWWLKDVLSTTRMHSASALTTAATIAVATMAAILLLITFTMSYAALYEAATWLEDTSLTWINNGDLRFLFPLGIDLVIVFFLVLDLLMEWKHARVPLNRMVVWFLSACTVALNVSQGDGLVSYATHAMPPLAVIVIAEGVAVWVRHLANLSDPNAATERIPFGRFIAHPLSTVRVMRVMNGWQIRSYKRALELEMLCQACWALLRSHYGSRLKARRKTPQEIRWLLGQGMQPHVAYPLVVELVNRKVSFVPRSDIALPPLRAIGSSKPDTPAPTADLPAPPPGPTPAPEPQPKPSRSRRKRPKAPQPTPEPTPRVEVVLSEPGALILSGLEPLEGTPTPAPAPEPTPAPKEEPTPPPAPKPVPVPAPKPVPVPAPRKTARRSAPRHAATLLPEDAVAKKLMDDLYARVESGELTLNVFASAERIRLAAQCGKKTANTIRKMFKKEGPRRESA